MISAERFLSLVKNPYIFIGKTRASTKGRNLAFVPVRRFFKPVFIRVHFVLRPVRSYILAIFWYFLGPTQLIQLLILPKQPLQQQLTPQHKKTYDCSQGDGKYPSSYNCAEFYVCFSGTAHTFHCPANLWYDPELGICNWPNMVDCKIN